MIQVTLMPHATLKAVFGQEGMIISVPEGSTVGEVLDRAMGRFKEEIEQRYGLQRSQELLQHCLLLLNGMHHSNPDALRIKVKEGDRIEIHAPLAGG
jgi:molybdopterin converting factor small subunit